MEAKLGSLKIGLSHPVRIMGIINVSFSFYKGSVKFSEKEIKESAKQHLEGGADFIDVGAVSTAPVDLYGKRMENNSIKEELKRITFAIKIILDEFPDALITVDTQRAVVAQAALNLGAIAVNDISGLKSDPKLAKVVADNEASLIAMAARKAPGDIWKWPDVIQELSKSIKIATSKGVQNNRIIIDPGIGSWQGRSWTHDLILLKGLSCLEKSLNHPVLVGISRKSVIGGIVNKKPEERLWGSLGASAIAVFNGASVIRTHDSKETKDIGLVAKKIRDTPIPDSTGA